MTDNGPLLSILSTKVGPTNGDAFRIEMELADTPNEERVSESITVSVVVRKGDIPKNFQTLPALADLQYEALNRAIGLLNECSEPIGKIISTDRSRR